MNIVADLHIHSHYSRATSKDLDFEHLHLWAQLKGVTVVGTGDIAHPGWLEEMHAKLEPAEPGLFRLKEGIAEDVDREVPPACRRPVRFLLAGEISNIYKRHDKVRKVHNVIFAPDLNAVTRIQAELEKIGNIRSDGRPILGLDSRDLLEIILEVDARCALIPAHVWTPWFSMLGSKSGFDSVEACFGDLTHHIFALETGLSSDPPMNWRLSALDGYTLISNSDAHSPPKLAREATLFDCELSYAGLMDAMRTGDPARFKGTIEFFPEEGKYHYDGHRKCGINWLPETTMAHDGICSVCGKPVTVGVYHRVAELADRPPGTDPARPHPFYSLIPLPEIIAEQLEVGVNSKRVQREYRRLLAALGPELEILLERSQAEIAAVAGSQLAEGIGRMRQGDVTRIAGYDGEYGVIKLFVNDSPQMALFGEAKVTATAEAKAKAENEERVGGEVEAVAEGVTEDDGGADGGGRIAPSPLNQEQQAAVETVDRDLVIVAGPGTGKTRTLTRRIQALVAEHGVAPEAILAITFTNKAAGEMRARLAGLLPHAVADRITVKTFHALGAQLLREHHAAAGLPADFVILDDEARLRLLRQALPALSRTDARDWLAAIAAAKHRLLPPAELDRPTEDSAPDPATVATAYAAALAAAYAVDFDDLVSLSVRLLEAAPEVLAALHARYGWVSVDEYQDVNEAQYRLLRLLTAGGANLCVIGDPDQAIYGFRGADHRYFLRFTDDYPGAQSLTLSRNYRSTAAILQAAQQVIARNPDRDALRIWTDFVTATKLELHHAPTDKAEAEFVVHQIERMVGGTSYFSLDSGRVDDDGRNLAFGDFAVLYRTGAQSRLLAEAFERSGMPFQTVGETPLFAHDDVRTLLAPLWLCYQPNSPEHWRQLLNAGDERFTDAKIRELLAFAVAAEAPLHTVRHDAAIMAGLDGGQRERLAAVGALLDNLADASSADTLALLDAVGAELADNGLAAVDAARLARVRLRANLYPADAIAFLEASVLEQETDDYDPRADRVALMTLHAAKGLEFPVVFIVGCEEGLLPYARGDEAPNVEEERRLFYVGMTRAQEKLVLVNAKRRLLFGRMIEPATSRFIQDIEAALVSLQEPTPRKTVREQPDNIQLSLFE
jgi:DNA helicase-2/ATP-dependent DNA helicase PcrA